MARAEAESDWLLRARAGDAAAFDRLVAPYRHRLHVHCYRMLGSPFDADDALQETLLAAWRGLAGFESRSTLGTWLYRIATNVCLRAIEQRPRRITSPDHAPARVQTADLGDNVEGPVWLEPLPDAEAGWQEDPAATLQRREHVALAFVAALQHLPGTQRAVLLLREVLEYSAAETAGILDTSVAAVNSALQRAQKTVLERTPAPRPPRHRRAGPGGPAAALRNRLGKSRRRGHRPPAGGGRALHHATAARLVRGTRLRPEVLRRACLPHAVAAAALARQRAAGICLLPAPGGGRPLPARRRGAAAPAGGADRVHRQLHRSGGLPAFWHGRRTILTGERASAMSFVPFMSPKE